MCDTSVYCKALPGATTGYHLASPLPNPLHTHKIGMPLFWHDTCNIRVVPQNPRQTGSFAAWGRVTAMAALAPRA